MSLSRRSFVQTLGAGAAGAWIGGRGREAGPFSLEALDAAAQNAAGPRIILSSNENPNGPGKAVLDAVRAVSSNTGRYPNDSVDALAELIARKHGVKAENVLVGSGSTQLLRTTTHVFCSKTAGLVAAIPAYEECARLRAVDGLSGDRREVERRAQDGPRRAARRVEGRGHGVLLQPQQPGGHGHRRQGDARLHRRRQQVVTEHDRSWSTRRTSSTPRCPATRP